MANLFLFEHPLSPYVQKVKIALREKGIAFETGMPSGIGVGGTPEDFNRASPRQEVPALIDGDTHLFDSRIIMDYIEEKWPNPPISPTDPALRARSRMIEEAVDTQLEAILWGLMELRVFKRGTDASRATLEARAATQIAQFQSWLSRMLGDAPWFGGDAFQRADMAVIPHLTGVARPPKGTLLGDWVSRCLERESVQLTAQEAEASFAGMAQVDAAVKAGLFKRQYRDHRLEWMIRSGGMEIVLDGIANDTVRFSAELA
jgi:glutathione S-transferase